ncbi:TetR family transcriptional regulator [Kitasatospora sp. HPMI-4]|uniref:TetR family transcriptional regulator n=1 Tax=Kitasatospora sp. HPMI-4 TaxID=3448443 RepID=UPI003F1CE7DA
MDRDQSSAEQSALEEALSVQALAAQSAAGVSSAGHRRAAAQRQQMRQDLAKAAMELFASQGYEETTVDQIAAEAGVARRTFFRYFRSKEEAIFPDHDDTLVRVADLLASAGPEEHPLDVVCRGIKEVLRMYASTPGVSVARYQLIRQVPALREREIAVVSRYERLFTRYLLGRFDAAIGTATEGARDERRAERDLAATGTATEGARDERRAERDLAATGTATEGAGNEEGAERDRAAAIPPGWQRGGDDDSMLAEVSAAAVVAAHNHVLRRWLRAGGHGDVEAQLDHSFEVIRGTFWATAPHRTRRRGTPVAPGAIDDAPSALETAAVRALSASPGGEVLITVARTDAPLDLVVDRIRAALSGAPTS